MRGIVKAADRLKTKRPVNIAMFGRSGVGKTTQAATLDPATSLVIDLESGTLALGDWQGDSLDVRRLATDLGAHPWEITRSLAVYLGGADPAEKPNGPYSAEVYKMFCAAMGDPDGTQIAKYETIFVDSITVASRWCLSWAQTQPEAISEKTGKPDKRGAYGLIGQELVRWLTHLQHSGKSIIVAGILDRFEDDLKRVSYSPQIEGSKTGRELDGIFDVVMTMDYYRDGDGREVVGENGQKIRAIYPTSGNRHGFPAKDRSGTLLECEEPHLGKLMDKIRRGVRIDSIVTTIAESNQTQTDQTADV